MIEHLALGLIGYAKFKLTNINLEKPEKYATNH